LAWLSELAAVSDHDGNAGLAGLGADCLHGVEDAEALISDLTEDGVLAIKMGEGGEAEEELGAVGVGASVGHGEDTLTGVLSVEVLVSELGAVDGLATSAVAAGEVTALGHELRDDSVVGAALEVEGLAGLAHTLLTSAERSEVVSALGGVVEEVDDDATSGLTAAKNAEGKKKSPKSATSLAALHLA